MGCQPAEGTHLFNHQLQTLCRSIRWNAEYLQGSVGSMQELIICNGKLPAWGWVSTKMLIQSSR